MKIIPLAADSFGTRSMACFVSTNDVNVLIDPSVSLGPVRYNKPPHAREIKRMNEHWGAIKKYAKKADILVITHYHYDHYNPEYPLMYKGKIIFLKHPTENINKSQKKRAAYFLKKIKGLPKQIEFSDGREFKFGKTRIAFSKETFHGTNNKLGYVTEVLVDDGKERFVHTSDIEGPAVQKQLDFILEANPHTLYLDGPLSYMLGFRYSQSDLNKSINNLIKIFSKTKIKTLIVDHHFLRDLKWKERFEKVFKAAEKKKVRVMTAAEYAGQKIEMLEANRNALWKEHPNEKAKLNKALEE
ncbi:MAG: hypothetical protein QME12_05890 [Nanoarchaeota archaeon]|nr:hypothetical protein [Nanoarchaeota archaeon]